MPDGNEPARCPHCGLWNYAPPDQLVVTDVTCRHCGKPFPFDPAPLPIPKSIRLFEMLRNAGRGLKVLIVLVIAIGISALLGILALSCGCLPEPLLALGRLLGLQK